MRREGTRHERDAIQVDELEECCDKGLAGCDFCMVWDWLDGGGRIGCLLRALPICEDPYLCLS
jgi:hypothetical protein